MLELNFQPFPVLTTERLVLRCVTPDDAEEVFFQRTDKEINKYIIRAKVEQNVEDTLALLNRIIKQIQDNETIFWAITLKGDNRVAGTITLWNIDKATHRGEVGYTLHSDYWRKGIMNEALLAVKDYGFTQMGLDIVEAYTHRDNIASRKLLERHGFTRDAELEANKIGIEEPETSVIYVLANPAKII